MKTKQKHLKLTFVNISLVKLNLKCNLYKFLLRIHLPYLKV